MVGRSQTRLRADGAGSASLCATKLSRQPTLTTLFKLARALGISVEALVGAVVAEMGLEAKT